MNALRIGLLVSILSAANLLFAAVGFAQSGPNDPAALDVNPIGKVMTVSGTAHIEHPAAIVVQANLPTGTNAPSKVGDLVYRGDIIQTAPNSTLGVTFGDGSSFNVAGNAKMEVNEFVYDPKGHANSSLMSLTKGTFTFIAGNIAHTGDMKVDTPVGTMGIRGTAPRVEIREDGTVRFSTLVEQKQ